MAIIDSVIDFIRDSNKPIFTQGDVLNQIKLQNPKLATVQDDARLAAAVMAKKPKEYGFFAQFDPTAPIEPEMVPVKVRNAQFYTLFPDLGKTDAITTIEGIRAQYPQLADVPAEKIAAKLESKNPLQFKGLMERLSYGKSGMEKAAESLVDAIGNASPEKIAAPIVKSTQKVSEAGTPPILKGIEDATVFGENLRADIQEKVSDLVRTSPPNVIPGTTIPISEKAKGLIQTFKATAGTVASTAADIIPFTPEEVAIWAAADLGLPILGKVGAEIFPKTAEFLTKQRSIQLSPEIHGKLNYAVSEFKRMIGMPQERGLTVYDFQKAVKEGRISPANAARFDEAIKNQLREERMVTEFGRLDSSKPKEQIPVPDAIQVPSKPAAGNLLARKAVTSDQFDRYFTPMKVEGEENAVKMFKQSIDYLDGFYHAELQRQGLPPNTISSDVVKEMEYPGWEKLSFRNTLERQRIGAATAGAMLENALTDPGNTGKGVILTAGIPGAAKTSSLKFLDVDASNFAAIFESNLANFKSAKRIIEKILASDQKRTVQINYVNRDPVEAFAAVHSRYLDPEKGGRMVTVPAFIKYSDAPEVIAQLANHFKDDPRVVFKYLDNYGNKLHSVDSIDNLRKYGYTKEELKETLDEYLQNKYATTDFSAEELQAHLGRDVAGAGRPNNLQDGGGSQQVPRGAAGQKPALQPRPSPGLKPETKAAKAARRKRGIVSFVIGRGGINPYATESADIRQLGRIDLMNKKGLSLDRMRELATEAGYLPEGSTGSDLIALLDQEIKSGKIVLPKDIAGEITSEQAAITDAKTVNVGDLNLKPGDTFQYVDGGNVYNAVVQSADDSGIKIAGDRERTLDVFDELRVLDAEKLRKPEPAAPKTETTPAGGEQTLLPDTPQRAMPGKALEPKKGQVGHRNLLDDFKPEEPESTLPFYDAARAQELKTSIAEGEMLLKGGRKHSGEKYSPAEIEAIRRSVDSTRAKLKALGNPDKAPSGDARMPPGGISVPNTKPPVTESPQTENVVWPGAPNNFNPRIEMPELVKLAEELMGQRPVVKKLMKSLGLFKGNRGINVLASAFRDPVEAAKILAHEIGHLIDWLPDQNLSRGNILGRLKTLHEFRKTVIDDLPSLERGTLFEDENIPAIDRKAIRSQSTNQAIADAGYKLGDYIKNAAVRAKVGPAISAKYKQLIEEEIKSRGLITKEAVTEELKAATTYWSPFTPVEGSNYTKYRFSSRELYAEALSMMLIQPDKLKEMAPLFNKVFWNNIDRKPEVKQALLDLDELLGSPEGKKLMIRERDIRDMFEKGEDIFRKKRAERQVQKYSLGFRLKTELIDKNTAIIEKVKEARKTGRLNPEDDPVYFLESHNYLGGKIHNLVQRIEQETFRPALEAGISEADIGEYLFLRRVTTERADIANPLGQNRKTAEDQLKFFMEKFNPERKAVLENVVGKLDKLGQELNREAFDAGLYKQQTYDQISTNSTYATFQVLDYLDEYVTSRVVHQVGTFKDIANPFTSTILKMVSLKRAIERNKLRASIVKFMKQFDAPGIQESEYRWTGKSREIKDGDMKGFGTIPVFENGSLKGYYVDPYIADSVNFKPGEHNNAIVEILRGMNSNWFRPVYVNMNLGFQSFNVLRDFQRFWKLNPETTFTGVIEAYAKAVPSAFSRVWGAAPDKIIKEMNESGMLGLTYNDVFHTGTQEDTQIEYLMRKYNVGPDREQTKEWYYPARWALDRIEEAGNFVETLPKVARYITAKDSKLPIEEIAHEVRVFAGSPDFMRRGSGYNWSNNVFLFSNAIKEGIRGDLEGAFKNPRTKTGYWWKTAALNIMPKVAMLLAAGGYFGKKIADNYAKQSEYDKANYTTIPLGETDNGQAAYLRIPQDEAGRFVSALFWKVMQLAMGKDQKLADSLSDIFSLTAGQVPSLSPGPQMVWTVAQYLAGQNPYDFFRGRTILTPDEQKARGKEGAVAMGKWFLDKAGLPMNWAHQGMPDDPTAVKTLKMIPAVNRFFKTSSYGLTQKYFQAKDEVDISLKRYKEGKREYSNEELSELFGKAAKIKGIEKMRGALKTMEKARKQGSSVDLSQIGNMRTRVLEQILELQSAK